MAKGGFPGGMNMQNMMRQAQQMQAKMQEMQAELEEREVEATAGGGVVRVVATGKKMVKSIEIKEEAVDPDDVEMLQDLVIAAVNEALAKADEMMQSEMGKITGGMNLGGLL
ncbi:MAG: YbaB/EbfC family nucleoid-associated protein [Christensenella sp.]|uniref:YbaB/EbfC family nucleoid-associated protein n=1 Tax=Christensenella sp. TaxID=1935934 RepID=UPI002B21E169|nr:YbaB/EbfC family nucleoid-associated protein [Christensenella sp.]MEA5002466.1 YbaB/EbfC family nucleoid-associated protein [Christensenella sp.]